ncbi:MAG: V-type ATPase subunit [Patescibacteria group bacterium]
MADYPYIFGLLKSLESKLLNQNDMERMIDAPSLEAAFRVFNDTAYADNLLEVAPRDFQKALNEDLKQTKLMFENLLNDSRLLAFLFSRFDFHNLKVIFKSKYSHQDLKEEESPVGTIPSESLRNHILSGAKVDLPPHLSKIIEKTKDLFSQDNSPHRIDSFFDKEMFSYLDKTAAAINNNYISDFLKLQITLANIKIFLRAKRLKKDAKWLAEEIIPGGRIPKKDLLASYDKEPKEALDACCFYFENKFRPIIEAYLENQNLWRLEQAFENYELDFLKETKRFPYGPEVAVAYYYANKNALRQVRLIMTGKLNGVPPAEIKERLRELW